jgi:archaellum biogenesis ATPase FlaH
MGQNILEAALAWEAAGCSVIPVRADGSKKPAVEWKKYQSVRASREQITEWFTSNDYGIAVVCGAISGNLELAELEARATNGESFDKIQEVADAEFDNWDKWVLGHRTYAEHTPSGGIHLLYRIGDGVVPGNTKLANNAANECLSETRGEGGYVIVAPSGGKVHATGEDWRAINGCLPAGIKTIPFSLRNELHGVLKKALDERPAPPVPAQKSTLITTRNPGDETPADHFDRVTSWAEILEPAGWIYHHHEGQEDFWTRPGKDPKLGHSASTGYADDKDRMYVWSSSSQLPTGEPMSKFFVYAFLNFPDMATAAASLRRQGFGTDRPLEYPDPSFSDIFEVSDQAKSPEKPVAATESSEPSGARVLRLTPASAFTIKRVKWLWTDRIPVGEITVMPGREGTGKSTLLAKICADITNGEMDGEYFGTPRNVIYIANEDSWSKTIAARMIAAGADMDRVFRLDLDPSSTELGGPNFPVDCRQLEELIKTNDVACVMIDPIVSALDSKIDVNKAREVRSALEPLQRVMDRTDCSTIALMHFNKNTTGDVATRVAGSRAFSEVARAVISVAEKPRRKEDDEDEVDSPVDEEPRFVITQTKNNLGRKDLPHIEYRIVSVNLETEDGFGTVIGRVEFTGTSDIGVEEILNQMKVMDRQSDRTQEIIRFVERDYAKTGLMSPVQTILEAFDDTAATTVRNVLSRAVKRGFLETPSRGMYRPTSSRSG